MTRFNIFWARCRDKYQELGVQQPVGRVTKDMLKADGNTWATLGSSVKVAAARAMVPVVLALSRDMYDGSNMALHRVCALEKLAAFYDILEIADIVPSEEQGGEIMELVDSFLLHYNFLAQMAQQQGELLYPVPPKLHFFWHVGHQARWLNPRSHWAYSHETFVGKISTCAESVMHGTSLLRLIQSIVQNYLYVIALRWLGF